MHTPWHSTKAANTKLSAGNHSRRAETDAEQSQEHRTTEALRHATHKMKLTASEGCVLATSPHGEAAEGQVIALDGKQAVVKHEILERQAEGAGEEHAAASNNGAEAWVEGVGRIGARDLDVRGNQSGVGQGLHHVNASSERHRVAARDERSGKHVTEVATRFAVTAAAHGADTIRRNVNCDAKCENKREAHRQPVLPVFAKDEEIEQKRMSASNLAVVLVAIVDILAPELACSEVQKHNLRDFSVTT